MYQDYEAASPSTFPIDKQLRELERELDMRRRAYPKWCRAGRMRTEDAFDRIEALKAAMRTIQAANDLHAFMAKTIGPLLAITTKEDVVADGVVFRLRALDDALSGRR